MVFKYYSIIRMLGFPSCQYIPIREKDGGGYWEMDEVEFTWFVLRFSGKI